MISLNHNNNFNIDNSADSFNQTNKESNTELKICPHPYVSLINEEWTYTMRRNMQEIIPGVFLGPYSAAMKSKLHVLLANNITNIICVRHSLESQFIRPNFEDHFRYLILEISDSSIEKIIQFFSTVRDFINTSLKSGGKVLVHGNAGISRSAALVIAYIMETYGLTLKEAYTIVQQRRFCINPNEGFMRQLKEFEPIYKAQKLFQGVQTSSENARYKRSYESDNEDDIIYNFT